MIINGTIHCLFEQSGTFKNEFINLGYPALDYDIQNEYGETDCHVDLFTEILKAYKNDISLFDKFSSDDLILAFFPCTYFSVMSQILHTWGGYPDKPYRERTERILQRSRSRQCYYELLIKLITVCKERSLRLIVENPHGGRSFLSKFFIIEPTIIDNNRALRGDVFKKPTAYWFVNCTPTHGSSLQVNAHPKIIKYDCAPEKGTGFCNKARSEISSDYARNFICDYIIGKEQSFSQLELFKDQ